MQSSCDSCAGSYEYNSRPYIREENYLPVMNMNRARYEQIGALRSINGVLPLGARAVDLYPQGYVQSSRGVTRRAKQWPVNSYFNFLQAQTWPDQIAFSGEPMICETCPPNFSAINVPLNSPSSPISPDLQPPIVMGRYITNATSPLPPVNIPRLAVQSGCTKSRMPFVNY